MEPSDFQGIVSLDQPLVEQLGRYLQGKESQVSHRILKAIHPLPREALSPVLPYSTSGQVQLSDAVEGFRKHIQQIAKSERPIVTPNDWEVAARQVNNALWEYVEVLEGSVVELFQQLGQIGFERWQHELIQVVETIKNKLDGRLEQLSRQAHRLEGLLWEYRWACAGRSESHIWLKKALLFWKSLLDRSLHSYIRKSRKYLQERSKWFAYRYTEYLKLKDRIERSMVKFKGYQVFSSLDQGSQDDFKKIYNLLKLWELNTRSKSLPLREPVRALRSAFSVDRVTELFTLYHKALRAALFERSRKFKEKPKETYTDPAAKRVVRGILKGYCAEIHTLGVTIGKYRDFFLKTHPNPYVRTRWGFAEWVVGPEPKQTKELLHLVYAVEGLDKLLDELNRALEREPRPTDKCELESLYREIMDIIHEMGQPLASRHVIRGRAERVMDLLQQMYELGSFVPEAVEYVGKVFSKALRVDWQYHVLFELSSFYELYAIHQGILQGPVQDRQHLNRMQKFDQLITQMKGWVKNRDTYRHIHEIETDMTDMKGFLQDFLAWVQRTAREETTDYNTLKQNLSVMVRQLLEYRYVFGKFFYYLHQHEPEGKLIRNQFLFVDQYFESMEHNLHEIRNKLNNTTV